MYGRGLDRLILRDLAVLIIPYLLTQTGSQVGNEPGGSAGVGLTGLQVSLCVSSSGLLGV